MKEYFQTHKNMVITFALLLIVAFAGYFYVSRDTSSDEVLISESTEEATTVEGDLLPVLLQLKKLRLDDSIFSSATWRSLNDFSKPLPSQAVGRVNPFAAMDSGISVASSTVSNR